MIYHAKFLLLLILVFGMLTQIFAGPGDLDLSFDGDGIVLNPNGGISDLTVQPDGKIVGAGGNTVVRYNADGTLDSIFGTGGKVILPSSSVFLTSVALLPDGKIVVAGAQTAGFNGEHFIYDFFVARLNANGSLDTTFNGTGTCVLDLRGNNSDDRAASVKTQSDGKIVVGGISSIGFVSYNYAIARFNEDGSLDTNFDGDGKVFTAIGSSGLDTYLGEIAIQTDGKILATGGGFYPAGQLMATVRYNTNGSQDTSFDGDGIVLTQESSQKSYAHSIALQSDGKIVVAGRTRENGSFDTLYVVRYNSNGTLDPSFGTGGRSMPFGGVAEDVEIQSDNKIVIATTFYNTQNYTGAVIRLNANGSPDTIFNGDGYSGIVIPSAERVLATMVAIQPNGKILIGGGAGPNAEQGLMIARFEYACSVNCGPRIADFDGDGKTDISVFRPGSGEWSIKRSSTGATVNVHFGVSTDKIVPGDYTGDGKADMAVFRPSTGEWWILRSEDNSYYSFQFGISEDVPTPADYDGDGKTDVAVFRPSNQVWFILNSSGGMTVAGFGIAGDLPVAADYDGDNKADIAIYRPSNGQWWLNRSIAGVIVWTFGVSTDRPVQGDYTGDGKADVAFWRPSTGAWFILRSENASYYAVPFGITGDIPSPGDYDGDGKFDPAVFRPSNATWWANYSTSGILNTTFGATGDTPVPSAFVP